MAPSRGLSVAGSVLLTRRQAVQLLLSCEHGGNRIPHEFRAAFTPPLSLLTTHRSHDPGTRELGAFLARTCGGPLFVNTATRLLIDANRLRAGVEGFLVGR